MYTDFVISGFHTHVTSRPFGDFFFFVFTNGFGYIADFYATSANDYLLAVFPGATHIFWISLAGRFNLRNDSRNTLHETHLTTFVSNSRAQQYYNNDIVVRPAPNQYTYRVLGTLPLQPRRIKYTVRNVVVVDITFFFFRTDEHYVVRGHRLRIVIEFQNLNRFIGGIVSVHSTINVTYGTVYVFQFSDFGHALT